MKQFCKFLILLAFCGVSNARVFPSDKTDGERIVGGEQINIDEIPHRVVMLYYGRHRCGGSIISRNWIFTAAHCTIYADAEFMSFRAGSSNKYAGGLVFQAKRIEIHENYDDSTLNYDFSLVELTKSIIFTQTMKAIRLPTATYLVSEGSPALVSGWGNTQSPVNPDLLRATEVFVIGNKKCQEMYDKIDETIFESMICAGLYEGGQDACQGDSGGPLIQNGMLIGVVSTGEGCALRTFPGIYSRVTLVRNWVTEVTGV